MEDMMRANILQEQVYHLQNQVDYWKKIAEERQITIDQQKIVIEDFKELLEEELGIPR